MRWHLTTIAVCLAALAALDSCDLTSKSAGGGTEGPSGDRRSREHETCSRSADCVGDLRCFDGVCRRGKLSIQGDLYAAIGDRELSAGRAREAAEAYGSALARYEQENVEPPPQLLCAQGSALAGEPDADKQKLERAARFLHRCLNGAPAGSFLRQRALTDLAGLMSHGLDPATLSRREAADVYLSRQATAPKAAGARANADSLTVQVKLKGRSRSSSYRKFAAFIEKVADQGTALTPCWKRHFEKTQKDTLAITLPFVYRAAWDEDETTLSSSIKVPAPRAGAADPATAEATACARQALAPLVEAEGKKLRQETRWQALATFTIAPRKR